MSHFADRSQRHHGRDDTVDSKNASASSSSGSRRPYPQHESDHRDRSPHSSRRNDDRNDGSAYPHKTRKLDWAERDTSKDGWRNRRDTSPGSQRPRGDSFRDSKTADLSIRGAATRQPSLPDSQKSPPRAPKHRPLRSPDLFERLSSNRSDARDDDRNRDRNSAIDRSSATDRYGNKDRYGQHAKRSRPDHDGESSRYPSRADGSFKLAPRGRYDDNGRRLDSDGEAAIAVDPKTSRTYSRRHGLDDSRQSAQSLQGSQPSYRREERTDKSAYSSNARRSATREEPGSLRPERRSPSPVRISRDISPPGTSHRPQTTSRDDVSASRQVRARQWGSAPHKDEGRVRQEADDDGRDRRLRRRSPSPARSDTSRSSRYREKYRDGGQNADKDAALQQRDRPARWKTNKIPEHENGWRHSENRWGARRHERERLGYRDRDTSLDRETESGRLLPKKTEASGRRTEENQTSKYNHDQQKEHKNPSRSAVTPEADRAATDIPRAGPGEAYVSINQVGEGTYGQVFKARSEQTGVLVALKKIRMESEKEGFPITAMREIKLLQALRHENIVRLHEMMVTRGSIYMVFEYMEHDLNGILAHQEIKFSEAHRKSLALQLLTGLEYLHKKAVLHRDLKGSNILLNNEGRLKLADFGLARFYAKRRTGDYTNRVVTLWYRPPELLFGETQYGPEVDMWGAGCLFLELFVRKPVFQGESEMQQVQVIADILGPITPAAWPGLERLAWYEMVKPEIKSLKDAASAEAAPDRVENKDFLSLAFRHYMPASALLVANGLLTYNPRKRWSSTEALQATYFSEAPQPELPARILSALDGEWHEYESRRARKRAPTSAIPSHRASLRTLADAADGQDIERVEQ